MQIGCTKKLIEHLGCEINNIDSSVNPLFNFTANIITVNRRKCIAVVNDGSGCGFVVYGVTSKDKKNLRRLILQGIETMLKSERFSEEIIGKYLNDCQDIVFTKTANRSIIARMNKFCERAIWFSELFNPNDIFQEKLLPIINDNYISYNDGYEFTPSIQSELMGKQYGISPYRYNAAVFDINLQLENSICTRRVTVPLDITFLQFHIIIQRLFEWENQHLHRFILKTAKNGRILEYVTMDSDEEDFFSAPAPKVYDEKELCLSDIFPEKKKIIYEYDYGDDWIHEIKLVSIIDDCHLPAPYCESANGMAPPEDCGGPGGFSRLIEVLSNPKDPEYKDMVYWYGYSEIHNKTLQHINFSLQNVLRINTETYYDYEE